MSFADSQPLTLDTEDDIQLSKITSMSANGKFLVKLRFYQYFVQLSSHVPLYSVAWKLRKVACADVTVFNFPSCRQSY